MDTTDRSGGVAMTPTGPTGNFASSYWSYSIDFSDWIENIEIGDIISMRNYDNIQTPLFIPF